MDESRPRFSTVANFRDVAVSINQAAGCKLLEPGKLFRSGQLDNVSKEDGDRLRLETNVKTVIDVEPRPQKFLFSTESEPRLIPDDENGVTRRNFLGVNYIHVLFQTPEYSKALIGRLSLLDKVFWKYHGLRYGIDPIAAIELSRKHAAKDHFGNAKDVIDYSGPCIKAVLANLVELDSYPIIIQCRYGKGLTSIIVLLVALLLRVPIPVVQEDYLRSDAELIHLKQERAENSIKYGCGPELLTCSPNWTRDISTYIEEIYGNVEGYLDRIDVNRDMQGKIISALRARSSEKLVNI